MPSGRSGSRDSSKKASHYSNTNRHTLHKSSHQVHYTKGDSRRSAYEKLTNESYLKHFISLAIIIFAWSYLFLTIAGQDLVLSLTSDSGCMTQTSPRTHKESYNIRHSVLSYFNPMSYLNPDVIEWQWAAAEPIDNVANHFHHTKARRKLDKYVVIFNMNAHKTIDDMMKLDLFHLGHYTGYQVYLVNIPLDNVGNIQYLNSNYNFYFIKSVLKTLKLYHVLDKVAIVSGTKMACPLFEIALHCKELHKIISMNSINCPILHKEPRKIREELSTPIYFFDNFGTESTHFSYIDNNDFMAYINITGQLTGPDNTKMWMYSAVDKFRYLLEETLFDHDLFTLDLNKAEGEQMDMAQNLVPEIAAPEKAAPQITNIQQTHDVAQLK